MLHNSKNILFGIGVTMVTMVAWLSNAGSKPFNLPYETLVPSDSSKKDKRDKSKPNYNPKDRQGDPISNRESSSPLLLKSPSTTEITLDSVKGTYTIQEKTGDMDYRTPSTMTFDEYMKYRDRQMMKGYFNSKHGGGDTATHDKKLNPSNLRIPTPGIGSIFGKDYVEIKPNGSVTLDFAGKWQRTHNPNVPVRQQRNGGFDFDQQISLNIIGNIGDKLKLTANWDTKASFDFQNNLKLQYTGYEEDIIQAIEAGNVTFPINSALISGSQNLFGIKTKLKFGRLMVTSVMSSQRGKQEEITIDGGSQSRDFEIRADQYEENKNFFLSHYFRSQYESSLKALPAITSGMKISRVDIYVTNTSANTRDTRAVVAYMDLGESDSTIYNSNFKGSEGLKPADNNVNKLYKIVSDTTDERNFNLEQLPSKLESEFNMKSGSDFVIINNARKLTDKEFRFNSELGYISLNTTIRQNEAIAVAYQYADKNGNTHQVGQIPGTGGDSTRPLILKLLKPNNVNTSLPTWDLMMKNVYQLGASQMSPDNFKLNLIYKNDESGADLPFLQEGTNTNRKLLLALTGLDRLGPNLDPPGDGNLDYIEGVTVESRTGRVIFPVLEPFGSNMAKYFTKNEENLKEKYVFKELYDSTRSGMLNYARKNKYFLKGKYQAGSADQITLPGLGIAQGSVIVSAGSTPLREGSDYTVNYQTGNITILNKGVLQSGQQIKIRFEKTDLFNFRRKTFVGTRLDYRINKDINIGGTMLRQGEAPQITRVSIGDEPSKNTIIGLDATFAKESRFLTKAVDFLPVIQTKAPSNVSFQAEGAGLFPGHSKAINKGNNAGGVSYLDDFESAETPYNFTNSVQKWFMGSTPSRFLESSSTDLDYTKNRARLAWYVIDPVFYRGAGGSVKPDYISDEDMKNHFVRQITPQEIYPKRDYAQVPQPEPVLNFAYYPAERGPYNYNTNLDSAGRLKNPKESWGAVTRPMTMGDIDFDNANIQYIEFWMMSPYIKSKKNYTEIDGQPFDLKNKGKLFFNLGSVSEDVMKDQKQAYENGLPIKPEEENDPKKVIFNKWGRVTKQAFLNGAFDNSTGSRSKQDVGLDGLESVAEETYFSKDFLNPIELNVSQSAFQEIKNDPSADDFRHYLDKRYDAEKAPLLQRYKLYNAQENNSPINDSEGSAVKSYTNIPDNEDINGDNNVDNMEEYYEYGIDIDQSRMTVGQNYIVDRQVVTDAKVTNGDSVIWYQFRIPIREPDNIVGNINGFKSIKFMRMYMTGFEKPVILRMAMFQLVANQWRPYQNTFFEPTESFPRTETRNPELVVSSVNIEENGVPDRNVVNYTTPPGFTRDQDVTSLNNRQMNEQSLQICVDELGDGQGRAVFKYVNLNLLNYKRFKMFMSANSKKEIVDTAATAFVRLGTDFEENYYEIEVPLHYTRPTGGLMSAEEVWRSENFIDVALEDLVAVKAERNKAGGNSLPNYKVPFKLRIRGRVLSVKGNPDLSAVQTLMIGIKNPLGGITTNKIQTCIWANEMLASDFVETAGYAAMASMNVQLADFATVTSSIRYTGAGFGSLDQKVSQRERNNTLQYSVASNLGLDKFIPGKHGIKLPLYVSHDRKLIMPKYNPLDPDMKLRESINSQPEAFRKGYESKAIDETVTNSWNLTNVRKVKTKADSKNHFWDVENLALSYGVTHRTRHNHLMHEYDYKNYKGGVGYTYNANPKSIEPFKNLKLKSPYFKLIKDFNFTPLPSSFTVRSDYDRRLTKTVYYAGDPRYDLLQDPIYEKSFTNNRTYGTNWNFTKSLTGDFTASTFSVFDEPDTLTPGTKEYNKEVWKKVKGFGRKKNYNQTAGLNYKLPLDKLPLTDWLGADTRYSASYNWLAGAKDIQDTLGNTISNKQDLSVNGRINLDKIYNRSKFLKEINNPAPTRKMGPQVKTDAKKDTIKEEKKREFKLLKQALRSVMSLKSINATYADARGTALGGYLPGVDYLGMQAGHESDMLPFILGSQNAGIRKTLSDKNMYSRSSALTTPFAQTHTQTINLRTSIEPVRDFRVQIDMMRNTTSNYQENYRYRNDTIYQNGKQKIVQDFHSDAPGRTGSYTISFLAIGSTFKGRSDKSDANSSVAFDEFEQYRHTIQSKRNSENRNGKQYAINSHEVMIPAFVAAYSGKDVNKVKLSSFPSIPLPNWRVDYTGLTRIKQISKVFTLFSISHSYNSTFTISNFTTSLKYNKSGIIDPSKDFNDPINADGLITDNGKVLSPYVIDQVVITERFAPLVGVNFRTKNKIEGRLEYTQDRSMSLTMSNTQIQEITNKGVVIGLGYAKAGIKLPIASGGNPYTILKNEVKFRVDASIRDGRTIQRKIDDASTTTQGNLNWQLKPTINYLVNNRLNVNFYFERTMNVPRVSSSFKRATTAFGVQLRFTLS